MESALAIEQFRQAADAALDAGDFWGCIPAVEALATGPFLAGYVNERLEAVRDGRNPGVSRGTEGTILLLRTPRYTLSVTPHPPGPFPPVAHLTDFATNVISVLAAGSIRYAAYRQPNPEPHDVFDPTRPLERAGTVHMKRGDVLSMRAGIDMVEVEHVDERAVVVNFKGATINPLMWTYDRETLFPKGFSVSRRRDSRIEFATKLLGLLGDGESADVMERLLGHEAHFVRWNAARALVRLDAPRGIAALELLLEDRHPDVRGAARRALAKLVAQPTAV